MYSVEKFFTHHEHSLQLKVWTNPTTLFRSFEVAEVHRPGLELAGFLARLNPHRVLIIGESEYAYLQTLDQDTRTERLQKVTMQRVPAFIYCKNLQPFPEHISLCNKYTVALLSSGLTTQILIADLKRVLDVFFAQRISIHGTLVDVNGVGLLLIGESGVGKSECALDLVERGHRLVADDVVIIHREAGVLIGEQKEPIGHIMEIHGIGFVDVNRMFGIRATRRRKRIEVVVKFEIWDPNKFYNRTGLDKDYTEMLETRILKVTIPVNPGKNIAVICEVIALDYLLKLSGVDVAEDFSERLKLFLQQKEKKESGEIRFGDIE